MNAHCGNGPWLLDYRTAFEVYESKANSHISRLSSLRAASGLAISCHEQQKFKNNGGLATFVSLQEMIIVQRREDEPALCLSLMQKRGNKAWMEPKDLLVKMGAHVVAHRMPVLSNFRSPRILTLKDICDDAGIICLSLDEHIATFP